MALNYFCFSWICVHLFKSFATMFMFTGYVCFFSLCCFWIWLSIVLQSDLITAVINISWNLCAVDSLDLIFIYGVICVFKLLLPASINFIISVSISTKNFCINSIITTMLWLQANYTYQLWRHWYINDNLFSKPKSWIIMSFSDIVNTL